jgi:hypothetical protein
MEDLQVTAARALRLTLVALVVSAASSCVDAKAAKYRLEGSLGQLMNLGYDEARLQLGPDDLSILFVRIHPLDTLGPTDSGSTNMMVGTSEDYPFKVSVALLGQGPFGASRADLTMTDGNGNPVSTFSRDVLNDPNKAFPRASRGTLFLDKVPVVDQTVTGDFNVTFAEGVEVASGRTVFAKSFSAKVIQ